ncbi:MAG: hypothetical protein ACJAYU_004989, partial [Bradymonadia bacterium]
MLSFVLAAVVVDWGKSDETGVLAPIEPAEFGEVGEDEDGRDEANAGHGTESASLRNPRRAGLNESLELVLDEGDLLGAVPEHVSDRRLADTGWVLETGLIRCAHRNQLGTTNDKPLQLSLVLITQVGRRRVEGEPVEGGHTGVDLVGLRKTTRGSSGIADAPGIGDVDFEAGVLDRPVGGALVSSCSLHEDQLFVYFTEPADQGGKALGAVPDDEL